MRLHIKLGGLFSFFGLVACSPFDTGSAIRSRQLSSKTLNLLAGDDDLLIQASRASQYYYKPDQWSTNDGSLIVTFSANCHNDLHISLRTSDVNVVPGKNSVPPGTSCYEIVGGGWGNTQSVLRYGAQVPSVPTNQDSNSEGGQAQGAVCTGQKSDYWFSFDDSSFTLKFGTGNIVDKNVVVQEVWKYHKYSPIKYFGFAAWDTDLTISNVRIHKRDEAKAPITASLDIDDGNLHTVASCSNNALIHIDSAKYVNDATSQLGRLCNGQSSCSIKWVMIFGSDPAPNVHKTLQLQYRCVPDENKRGEDCVKIAKLELRIEALEKALTAIGVDPQKRSVSVNTITVTGSVIWATPGNTWSVQPESGTAFVIRDITTGGGDHRIAFYRGTYHED